MQVYDGTQVDDDSVLLYRPVYVRVPREEVIGRVGPRGSVDVTSLPSLHGKQSLGADLQTTAGPSGLAHPRRCLALHLEGGPTTATSSRLYSLTATVLATSSGSQPHKPSPLAASAARSSSPGADETAPLTRSNGSIRCAHRHKHKQLLCTDVCRSAELAHSEENGALLASSPPADVEMKQVVVDMHPHTLKDTSGSAVSRL